MSHWAGTPIGTLVCLRLYSHEDQRARVVGRDSVEADLFGWDAGVGDLVPLRETEGSCAGEWLAKLTTVSRTIHTGDVRGHYILAEALVVS